MKVRIPGFVRDEMGREIPVEVFFDVTKWKLTGAQINGECDEACEFAATITTASGWEPYRGWAKARARDSATQAPREGEKT